jgi:hypothetical protein
MCTVIPRAELCNSCERQMLDPLPSQLQRFPDMLVPLGGATPSMPNPLPPRQSTRNPPTVANSLPHLFPAAPAAPEVDVPLFTPAYKHAVSSRWLARDGDDAICQLAFNGRSV